MTHKGINNTKVYTEAKSSQLACAGDQLISLNSPLIGKGVYKSAGRAESSMRWKAPLVRWSISLREGRRAEVAIDQSHSELNKDGG